MLGQILKKYFDFGRDASEKIKVIIELPAEYLPLFAETGVEGVLII